MEEPPSTADKLARLAQLEADFRRALEAEKLEALAEFAAGAGHEINNPLTVISGRAQLLLREEVDPERRHALALISAQALRVYEMIADMMLFARPPRPEFQPIELIELIDRVVDDFSPRCARQEATIIRTGDDGPIRIEADPAQLNVAIRAICQNSLEAIPTGGHIEIDCRSSDSRLDSHVGKSSPSNDVWIRISDDGPGIKPEERRHIFDPFYSARQAGRGLGLGLSKAWRIITNHGGRIEVEGQPTRGATFVVALPVVSM